MTIKIFLLSIIITISSLPLSAATTNDRYSEPRDTSTVDRHGWNKWNSSPSLTWASKDVLYRQYQTPQITSIVSDTIIDAWRGERIGIEALIIAPESTENLMAELSELRRDGKTIAAPGSYAAFMRYVITTAYNTCGYPDPDLPTYTVPDMIDLPMTPASVDAYSVRPVWCTIEVPREIDPGIYEMTLRVYSKNDNKDIGKLHLNLNINRHTLPKGNDMAFYLDMWQQPYAISRFYNVEPWSDAHLAYLRPYAEMLVRAGQKTVSAILFYEPWGEQSNDKFQPMIETTRNLDGSWSYDYAIFDRYVEFMADCGINANISCFTMIPWEMKFRYFDMKKGEYDFLVTTTDTQEYRNLWTDFLQKLTAHLKSKGWFEKTFIVMDERALPDMLNAYRIAKEAVPDIKMSLAGNYHSELIDKLDCYTIIKGDFFPDEVLRLRRDKGYISLMYTCCATPAPGLFSNSAPADAAYLPVYSTAVGFDGYLHWSFMNWTDSPLTDTRFHMFAPGDTYIVYPDGRSSIRYERMIEGIQMSEKIRLLRQEIVANKDLKSLSDLECALLPIRTGAMTGYYPTSTVINRLQKAIADLSRR